MFDPILPVRSDSDVLAFARSVLDLDLPAGADPALAAPLERLTWLLLLDGDDRPLPVVVPIEHVPVDPDPHDVGRFADAVRQLLAAVDGAGVIVVWQRPGSGEVRMQEADWAEAVAAAGLPLVAQVLAGDDGLRVLDPVFDAIMAA